MSAMMVACAVCGTRVEAYRPSAVPGMPGPRWFPRPHAVPVTLPAEGLVEGAACRGQYAPGVRETATEWVPVPCRWTVPYRAGISVNHSHRPTGRGGRVLTAAAAAFRDEVIVAVRRSRACAPPGPLELLVVVHPPSRRRLDADNPLKLVADAVAAGLGIDDARFARVVGERGAPDPARPRVEVELLALGNGRQEETGCSSSTRG